MESAQRAAKPTRHGITDNSGDLIQMKDRSDQEQFNMITSAAYYDTLTRTPTLRDILLEMDRRLSVLEMLLDEIKRGQDV